ncbi:MAG: VanW family protein [uncultured bacterium]|nr:MAG: VanW family protein [uncultured bacterium]
MEKFKYILGSLMIFLFMMITIYAGFRLAFRKLILPKVEIAGVEMTGMDKATALKLVSSYFETDPNKIVLEMDGKEVAKLTGIKVEYDLVWAVDQAMSVGRNGNILTQITEGAKTLLYGRTIDVPVSYNKSDLEDLVDQISDKLNQKPVWPKLIKENETYKLVAGKNGVEVKTADLMAEVVKQFGLPGHHAIQIPTNLVETKENDALVKAAIESLEKWGKDKLTIRFRDFEKQLGTDDIPNLFGLTNDPIDQNHFELLITQIKPLVETDPRDAVFVFEDNKVNEFKPEITGATIDIPMFRSKLAESLLSAEDKVLEIPVILTYPKIKTGDINNLGIKELIGTGKSTFFHSIPGRVFNVNLAASRISGTLVGPGEEFSFVKAVGDISKTTGYQTAYIISEGRTVLGDGGGVCQVSTTTFRAALDAGLPITERKAHAYRVGYYEQDSPPGIDATVYYPTADLKFLNDTGNYILIQETVDTKSMSMKVEIYGTSDGRKSSLSKPRISNQSPPPPTMYVDDPTLPLGTMKQIDWSAWGAKVAFDYKVERNGEVVYEKTFVSNYQPWQAIYLKGTGDLAAR